MTFTPTDTTDYTSVTKTVQITVTQAAPVITWNNPANITFGTTLSATQLNATASVGGTFAYTPAAGTVPASGTDTLSVTFTPTDTTDYTSVTKTVQITVTQAAPVITWNNPASITYGTALSATQLNATASVGGSFAYTPVAGTVPASGTDTLSVTFTPTDTTDYTSVTKTVQIVVTQTAPVITWAPPAAITYGTALSATQLNATATVGGSSLYPGHRQHSSRRHRYALGDLHSDRHHRLLHGHRNRPAHGCAGCSGDHVEQSGRHRRRHRAFRY